MSLFRVLPVLPITDDRAPLPPSPAAPAGCACHGCGSPPAGPSAGRRLLLQQGLAGAALALAAPWPAHAADDHPQAGDWLVPDDDDATEPLGVKDLKANAKQQIVWPWDPVAQRKRDSSRLNKLLLVRLDPATLDSATRERAADGVLAYSAVCTHQGCDVSSWRSAEKTLLCFCHFSQFQPAQGAAVVAGPAPRPLPWVPLRSEAGRLVLAGGFNQPPGGHQA